MSEKPDGGPAFPVNKVYTDRDGDICSEGIAGMTLRDYFAAKALQSLARDFAYCDPNYQKQLAKVSYEIADMMLEEREK